MEKKIFTEPLLRKKKIIKKGPEGKKNYARRPQKKKKIPNSLVAIATLYKYVNFGKKNYSKMVWRKKKFFAPLAREKKIVSHKARGKKNSTAEKFTGPPPRSLMVDP